MMDQQSPWFFLLSIVPISTLIENHINWTCEVGLDKKYFISIRLNYFSVQFNLGELVFNSLYFLIVH